MVAERSETGQELLELHLPIEKYARRNNLSQSSQLSMSLERNQNSQSDEVPRYLDRKQDELEGQWFELFSYRAMMSIWSKDF